MSIGEAKALHKRTGQKVMIVGRDGRPVKSDLFHGLPYLVTSPRQVKGPYQRLVNGSGVRPYIALKTDEKWTWRKYKPIPGEVQFTPQELAFAEPYRGMVMLVPEVKKIGHSNKDWGWASWQTLDRRMWGHRTVQCGPSGGRRLQHATAAITDTFRQALAVLSVCRAVVTTEGGMMHGAAALGVPAVVIWSEFISPEITGYAQHHNLRKAGEPCGRRVDCEGCRKSLAAISPASVFEALTEILNAQT
jgi:ADP-heptose:LPS heptosyltransferase